MKLKQQKPSLQSVFKKLNRDNPFTNKERVNYSVKERNLIRGLQLKNKISKDESITLFDDYKKKSQSIYKKNISKIRKYIETQYGENGGILDKEIEDFNFTKRQKRIRDNKKITTKFLNNKNNQAKNPKTYDRVKKAIIKYPNASLGELRHGVNSQWSQKWRLKNGLSRNYK